MFENYLMPGRRAQNQKQVLIIFRESFLKEIDAAVNRLGFSDRANLIRCAVLEKLAREGISLPKELATAPDRAGKGGRPKTKLPPVVKTLQKALKKPFTSPSSKKLH